MQVKQQRSAGQKKAGQMPPSSCPGAFTLLELLVVIVIIGILAAVGLPAIRGMNKSNSMTAANRQLLDDINYARQRAMADHTSVYMVFMPPFTGTIAATMFPIYPGSSPSVSATTSNLYGGQLTTYALVSLRSVGDQPGRPTPRYLTGWRTLPAGIYIATNKFIDMTPQGYAPPFFVSSRAQFPFPVATNSPQGRFDFPLPHFGFNYLGQLICRLYTNNQFKEINVSDLPNNQNQMYIPLVRGSLLFQHNPDGTFAPQAPDIQESPAGTAYYVSYNSTNALGGSTLPTPDSQKSYNQIYIDPLTGRAKVQHLQIQ